MTTINLAADKPVNGTPADAIPIANAFDTIQNAINGGLDDGNIAVGGPPIVGTKLAAARVGVTTAGLGGGVDGALGFIRAGSTPFDFVPLIFDATYGKWVSGASLVYFQGAFGADPSIGTSYSLSSSNDDQFGLIPWRSLSTAGLTLQLRLVAHLSAGASSTMFAAVAATVGDKDGTLSSYDIVNVSAEVSTTTTGSPILKDSGWVNINASLTLKDFILFDLVHKRSGANNGTVQYATAHLRWVG